MKCVQSIKLKTPFNIFNIADVFYFEKRPSPTGQYRVVIYCRCCWLSNVSRLSLTIKTGHVIMIVV